MTANITPEHRRAFEAQTNGRYENFALVICFCGGKTAVAIATFTVHPAGENGGDDECPTTPPFVSVVPGMRLNDHDGREP